MKNNCFDGVRSWALHLRPTKRKVTVILGLWVLFLAVSLGLTAFHLRISNLRELTYPFATWRSAASEKKALIFAPHCDDEIIATGGMIRQITRKGSEVWVVLVTNGDGFRAAVALDNRQIETRPEDFVEFGYKRQRESTSALRLVGVPQDHVIFLGYPDRGLQSLWVSNWKAVYTSPYTRDNRSPYTNSFTRNVEYNGEHLLSDIKKIIDLVQPDEIYIPHPHDQHPDHWATSAFVTTALYELNRLNSEQIGLYLVHRGDWPVPQGLHQKIELAPPAALTGSDTKWYQLPLSEDVKAAKLKAIGRFKSQKAGVRRFIRSFVRENELFGIRPIEVKIPERSITVDGKIDDWAGVRPVMTDPKADGLITKSRPSADLIALYAAKDESRLYFRISLRGPVKPGFIYELWAHRLGASEGTTKVVIKRGPPPPDGWKIAYATNDIELSCPADFWEGSAILVSGSTRRPMYHIDRFAFKILLSDH